ncbi:MAG: hypothetical protein EXQ91_00610 [Alphaproteobacteria bacterium]|nr:hypothetical protein [Alphaproteobacteria bacterium]
MRKPERERDEAARLSADVWRAKVKRDAAHAVTEVEQSRTIMVAKTQRLRALRVAKEAADKIVSDAAAVERKSKVALSAERKAERKKRAAG